MKDNDKFESISDEQTAQSRAQAALDSYNAMSNEVTGPPLISIRKARHLDVDQVLARSLPKVAGE